MNTREETARKIAEAIIKNPFINVIRGGFAGGAKSTIDELAAIILSALPDSSKSLQDAQWRLGYALSQREEHIAEGFFRAGRESGGRVEVTVEMIVETISIASPGFSQNFEQIQKMASHLNALLNNPEEEWEELKTGDEIPTEGVEQFFEIDGSWRPVKGGGVVCGGKFRRRKKPQKVEQSTPPTSTTAGSADGFEAWWETNKRAIYDIGNGVVYHACRNSWQAAIAWHLSQAAKVDVRAVSREIANYMHREFSENWWINCAKKRDEFRTDYESANSRRDGIAKELIPILTKHLGAVEECSCLPLPEPTSEDCPVHGEGTISALKHDLAEEGECRNILQGQLTAAQAKVGELEAKAEAMRIGTNMLKSEREDLKSESTKLREQLEELQSSRDYWKATSTQNSKEFQEAHTKLTTLKSAHDLLLQQNESLRQERDEIALAHETDVGQCEAELERVKKVYEQDTLKFGQMEDREAKLEAENTHLRHVATWTPLTERMPTREDADRNNLVLWYRSADGAIYHNHWAWCDWEHDGYTHFRPTNLPEAEKEKDDPVRMLDDLCSTITEDRLYGKSDPSGQPYDPNPRIKDLHDKLKNILKGQNAGGDRLNQRLKP